MAKDEHKFDLAFVLVSEPVLPDPEQLAASATELGLPVVLKPDDSGSEEVQLYQAGEDLTLMVSLVPAPHPDAGQMQVGVTSPPREVSAAAPAHYIVALLGQEGSVRERDVRLVQATAAVVRSSPCVAAMFGHGVVFHRPELFADVELSGPESLPVEVCVDLTVAGEEENQISVLTHGMERYGRENLLVYADYSSADDAIAFTMVMADWLLTDHEKVIPTGDTVGRDADERIKVERASSPVHEQQTVMVLRLQSTA